MNSKQTKGHAAKKGREESEGKGRIKISNIHGKIMDLILEEVIEFSKRIEWIRGQKGLLACKEYTMCT